jgi:hypothetical protein
VSFADDTTALSVGMSIQELVAVYRKAEGEIRAGFTLVRGALDALNGAFALGHLGFTLRTKYQEARAPWGDPDEALVELRRSIWAHLIERTQIRKAMSIQAWKDLQQEIDNGEPPEITEENVAGMIARFRADAPAMLEQAVKEVFDFLRPPRSDYKTNTELELGERVILKWYVERGWGRNWHVDYNRSQHLIALENVFGVLEGKIRDVGGTSNLEAAIEAIPCTQPCVGETPLFAFRGYKNRTLHLRFKRMDLVARLNQIAGGARLKPSRAA